MVPMNQEERISLEISDSNVTSLPYINADLVVGRHVQATTPYLVLTAGSRPRLFQQTQSSSGNSV